MLIMASNTKKTKELAVKTVDTRSNWCSFRGFLDTVTLVEEGSPNARFMFFLGAGASVSSGIPAASQMAWEWVLQLFRQEDPPESLDNWLSKDPLHLGAILSLENVASYYSQIYDRRFPKTPVGFSYIENKLANGSPNTGYVILAHIIEHTRHKFVLTTNFDNLVADAYALCFHRSPRVFVHEALASFLRPLESTPTVAKVHRDVRFGPHVNLSSTGVMDLEWAQSLKKILEFYVPIVIGYGGNDGSIMGFLEELDDDYFGYGLFWLYYEPDGLPSERVRSFVARKGGALVPIQGFDEALICIGVALNVPMNIQSIRLDAERMLSEVHDLLTNSLDRIKTSELFEELRVSEFIRVNGISLSTLDDLESVLTSGSPTFKMRLLETAVTYFGDIGYIDFLYYKVHKELGQKSASFARLKSAIEKEPDNKSFLREVYHAVQLQNYKTKDVEDAVRLYSNFLRDVDSEDSYVWNSLGLMLDRLKQYEEAINAFEKSKQFDADPIVCSNLADTYFSAKKYEQLIAFTEELGTIGLMTDGAARYGLYARIICDSGIDEWITNNLNYLVLEDLETYAPGHVRGLVSYSKAINRVKELLPK